MATTPFKSKIHFYICDSYIKELQSVTQEYRNVECSGFKAKCKFQAIPDLLPPKASSSEKQYILGGCALHSEYHKHDTTLLKETSCLYLFAPQPLIESYIAKGAYLLTSGWLEDWEYIVQDIWGFDQASAADFFAEFCKELVLLDTLIDPDSKTKLQQFATFVNRDYRIVPIGLEYFRSYIQHIIDQQTINELHNTNKKYTSALQEKSNYAMAFDLMGRLNEKLDEREIIDKILEMFTLLFAPRNIVYLSIQEDQIVEDFSTYEYSKETMAGYLEMRESYNAFEESFWIKLIYNQEIIGLLSIENIAFKEYVTPYLNLAIVLSDLCALAIENARSHLKTQEVQAQLAQNAKLASMGEMLSAIAHQWRQPLNSLNLNIEMLEEYYEAGQIDEAFIENFIEKNTTTIEFLSQTISDFSDFFRIKKTKESFSIQKAIRSILDIVKVQLSRHNITCNIVGEDCSYYGLGNELKQVLLNLINNAKDAIIESKQKRGTITLTINKKDDTITLTVQDSGGGIDPKLITRVFEPYFSTKEEGKGVGLGLYIAKMIVEEHMQGTLSVHNTRQGALFEIKLVDDHDK